MSVCDPAMRDALPDGVVNRQPPAQHPAKAAVFVLHPVFTLEMRRQSSLMRGDFILDPFAIRDMDSVQPFLRARLRSRLPDNPT